MAHEMEAGVYGDLQGLGLNALRVQVPNNNHILTQNLHYN